MRNVQKFALGWGCLMTWMMCHVDPFAKLITK